MVATSTAEVQPGHVVVSTPLMSGGRNRRVRPPVAAQRARSDLLGGALDDRTILSKITTIENVCRNVGWTFQDTFVEYADAYGQLSRVMKGEGRYQGPMQIRRNAERHWAWAARTADPKPKSQQDWASWLAEMQTAIQVSDIKRVSHRRILTVLAEVCAEQQSHDAVIGQDALSERVLCQRSGLRKTLATMEAEGTLSIEHRSGFDDVRGAHLSNRYRPLTLAQLRARRGPAGEVGPAVARVARPLLPSGGGPAGPLLQRDLFVGRGSLGLQGLETLQTLGEGDWRRADLGVRLQLERTALWRRLQPLIKLGLVEIVGDLVRLSAVLRDATTITEVNGLFDCAADDLGVTGSFERLRTMNAVHALWAKVGNLIRHRDWELFRLKTKHLPRWARCAA